MLLPRRRLLIGSAALPFAGLRWRPARADGNTRVMSAIAMHGDPKYGPDFKHFDYASPDAPKGGEIHLAVVADTFDNFNPYTLRGQETAAVGVNALVMETLTTGSYDEAFTEYGLLAETIEVPDDRSWVAYKVHSAARWSDGQPVTADDVVFSFETLKTKGHPFYQAYYASVDKATKLDDGRIKFTFSGGQNRELPLIMGQLPILPKHYWEGRDFEATNLDIPVGSGPYKIKSFDAGRSVTYERVKDYWGKDLPVNAGQNNWDTVRWDYYHDETVSLEAFKAGNYDF